MVAPEVLDLARQEQVFDAVIAGVAEPLTFQQATGDAERVRAATLTPNAFSMLGVRAHLGRVLRDEDAAPGATPVAVLSDAFWRERLGQDPGVVGRVLRMGSRQVTVVGVMPPAFRWWDREVWLPLRLDPDAPRTDRRFYVQGRLRQGITPSAAERELRAFAAGLHAAHPELEEYTHLTISLHTLLDDVLRDLRPTLEVLLAAVLLVMLVAAMNLSGVMLGRAASREGEFAVRFALGATRTRVTSQLLIETIAIGTIGAVIGVSAAMLLLPPTLALVPYGFIPAEATVSMDWRVVACSIAVSLLMGTGSAFLPAWRASELPLAQALRRNDLRTGTRRVTRARYAFVCCQLAVTVALMTGGVAALWTLARSIARDPGYDARGVWTARVSEADPALIRTIVDATAARTAGAVAAISALPIGELPTALISTGSRPGAAGPQQSEADILAVTPDVQNVFAFRLREGRPFQSSDDGSSRPVAIVTTALARQLWPEGGLARQLTVDVNGAPRSCSVVGIMQDVDSRGDGHPRPLVLVPMAQFRPAGAVVIAGRATPKAGVAALRAAVRAVDAGAAVYETARLEQARRDALGSRLLAAVMLGAFCVAVLVLSIVGLHTLMAEIARERRREMAIRLALGATPRMLFLTDLRRTLLIVGAACLLAAPAVLAMPMLLGAVFQGIAPAVLGAAPITVLLVAAISLAAAAGPACRSSFRTSAINAVQ